MFVVRFFCFLLTLLLFNVSAWPESANGNVHAGSGLIQKLSCSIQQSTEACKSVFRKLPADSCEDSSSLLQTGLLCGPVVANFGLRTIKAYKPAVLPIAEAAVTQLAARLTPQIGILSSTFASRASRYVGAMLIPGIQVLSAGYLLYEGYEQIKPIRECFNDINERRAILGQADRAGLAIIESAKDYLSDKDLRDLRIPEQLFSDNYLANQTCGQVQAYVDYLRSASYRLVDRLIREGKINQDPRKTIFLSEQEDSEIKLLSESLPCLSVQKQSEVICAIGNLTSGHRPPRILKEEKTIAAFRENTAALDETLKQAKQQKLVDTLDLAGRRKAQAEGVEFPNERRTGHDRREIVPEPNQVKFILDPVRKKDYMDKHFGKVYASESQMLVYRAKADMTRPDGNTVFMDIDNSKLKRLNTITMDQDFVTAISNHHKEILFDTIKDLQKKYPDLKIDYYSDAKNSSFAFSGKKPEGLQQELDKIFQSANNQFLKEIAESKTIRVTDVKDIFRGAFGETSDQISTAVRAARLIDENRLYHYNDPKIQKLLNSRLAEAKELHKSIPRELQQIDPRFVEEIRGVVVPSTDLLDLFRKNPDVDDLVAAVNTSFTGSKMSVEQAKSLQKYTLAADIFSAKILITKREFATLSDADNGGFSVDIAGMGAKNLQETLVAVAKGQTLDDVIAQSRIGEREATSYFKKSIQEIKLVFRNFLVGKNKMDDITFIFSGDDGVGIFTKNISTNDKVELTQKLSRSENPSRKRLSFISDIVTDSQQRTLLARHGEAAEKALRKELAGKIHLEKLKQLTFAMDMQSPTAGSGTMQLLVGNSRVQLDANERLIIKEAYNKALEKLNTSIFKNTGVHGKYTSRFSERF